VEKLQLESVLTPYSLGGFVHPDVAALLTVQEDDVTIHDLETRLAELRPRLDQMAKERDKALAALEQARQSAESEERRRAEIASRVAQHKAQHDKNQQALNNITSMREATAATAQLDQTKRMIDEDERELAAIGGRLQEANRQVDARSEHAADLEQAQTEARSSLSVDQEKIEAELQTIRDIRENKAKGVPRNLLSQYERIRSRKRVYAVFPLRGMSCGNCDTNIPMQRRSVMTGSAKTEICEGCGVMLYATD
jgi:predicted  nucleic acid-binding Zn-ribbon protein